MLLWGGGFWKIMSPVLVIYIHRLTQNQHVSIGSTLFFGWHFQRHLILVAIFYMFFGYIVDILTC